MHHLLAFSPDLDADGSPNQMLKSQRLPLPHLTLARLPSCHNHPSPSVGLPPMLQDFLASIQGHAHLQSLQGI